MRYLFIVTISIIVVFNSFSQKKVKKGRNFYITNHTQLSDKDQRRFDIFFYEACREKMLGNYDKVVSYLTECLRIDPTSSATMYELAQVLISNKKYNKAQNLLEKACEFNPNNKWYKVFLADLYQNNDFNDKAINVYKSLIIDEPRNEEYLYMLAQLYKKNKQFKESIEIFNRLEEVVGINEVISIEKEKLYIRIGKRKKAFNEINNLININPNYGKYLIYKGDLFIYYKDFESAIKNYKEVLKIDSTYHTVYFSLFEAEKLNNNIEIAKSYYRKGIFSIYISLDIKIQHLLPILVKKDTTNLLSDKEVEEALHQMVNENPFDVRSYIALGEFLKNKKRYIEALDVYRKASVFEKNNSKLWEEILFLEIDLYKFDLLLEDTKEALILFPNNAMFYYLNANALVHKKNNKEALIPLSQGIIYVGNNSALESRFYGLKGDIFYELGQKDSSFINYNRAIEANDKNIVVLNNYSYYLSLENKDLELAEKMSSRCIELEPGNATYLDTYAWVLFKRNRYLEAKFIIERAIDNGGGENNVIRDHYGDILYFTGNIEDAVTQWKKAKELGLESTILNRKIELMKYIEESEN